MIFIWTFKNLRETEAEAMVMNVIVQSFFSEDLGGKSVHSGGAKITKKSVLTPNTLKIPQHQRYYILKRFNS